MLRSMSCINMSLFKAGLDRDVHKHSSARLNQVKIRRDGLVKISARPADEYDYLQITITYQFRKGSFKSRQVRL